MGAEDDAAHAAVVLPAILEAVLDHGRCAQLTVTGESMRPTLRSGDRVTVASCAPGDARLGDLLLYRRAEGGLALHRLVRRGEGWLQTGGDALWRLDARVAPAALIGRAIERERAGRARDLAVAPLRRAMAVLVLVRGIATARLGRLAAASGI